MKLTARERRTVWVGAVLVVLALAYRFWLGPVYERRARLASDVERLHQQVQRVSDLVVRYRELQKTQKAFDRLLGPGGSQGSLLRTIEATLRGLGLKNHLVSANPSRVPLNPRYAESTLQVSLAGLRWKEVIQLLHRLESDKMRIWVKKLRLVANEGTKRLDGELTLSAFVKRSGKGNGMADIRTDSF